MSPSPYADGDPFIREHWVALLALLFILIVALANR